MKNAKNHLCILIMVFIFISIKVNAQQFNVVDNKGTINTVFKNNVTTASTSPTTPIEGDVWFDTTANQIKIYDADEPIVANRWKKIADIITKNIYTQDGTIIGDRTITGSNTNRFDIGYFSAFMVSNTKFITFDATESINLQATNGIDFRSNTIANENFQVKKQFIDASNNAGTTGQVLSSTGTGTNWIDNTKNKVTTGSSPHSNPIEGDVWFNNTDNKIKIWDGTNWKQLSNSNNITTNFYNANGTLTTHRVLNGSDGTGGKYNLSFNNIKNFTVHATVTEILSSGKTRIGSTGANVIIEADTNTLLDSNTSVSKSLTVDENFQVKKQFIDASNNAGTTGQILSSTGIGTNWIDNTTTITGTTGSVFFAGTDGKPTENNGELFWDITNNNLHIGALLTSPNSNKLNVRGTIRSSRGYKSSDGTANRPDYRFTSDVDTGMYRIGVDQLGFSTNGTNALSIDATQNISIPKNLSVTGTYADTSGDAGTTGQILSSTGTGTNWIDNTKNKVTSTATSIAPNNPIEGDVWFDTTANEIKIYDADEPIVANRWKKIADTNSPSDNIYTNNGSLTSDRMLTGNNKSLRFYGLSRFDLDYANFIRLQSDTYLDLVATTAINFRGYTIAQENFKVKKGLLDKDGDIGTTGQILSSTGTGTDWIDNTTTITGTAGSVFFAGTNGKPTENNAHLFWDNTNDRLRIGLVANGTNKLSVGGTTRTSGLNNSNGTANQPSYRFSSDSKTGMYRIGANQLGFSTNGTNALSIDATQNISIPKNLSVTGTYADTTGDVGTTGQILSSTGTGTNWVDNSSLNWSVLGNSGTTNTNFLGTTDAQPLILKTNNIEKLRLHETKEQVLINGATSFNNHPFIIRANGNDVLAFQDNTGSTKWHWNILGNGLNFVETGVADYRLFLKYGGNVGIGTNDPTEKLDINGKLKIRDIPTVTTNNEILTTDATNGVVQKKVLISADANNQITASTTDGGVYVGPTVYTGSFIINAPNGTTNTNFNQIITGLPFKPSQITFVAHPNIESFNIDRNNGVGNNTGTLQNSFGTMNGFARYNHTANTTTQSVIFVGGSGSSINNISRLSSDINCIGLRYTNNNGNNLGKIMGNLTSFDTNGFTINVKYTKGHNDIFKESLIVLYTAYK